MSDLSLIVQLVQALVWPVTVLMLALIFRERVRALLGAISRRVTSLTEISAPGGFNAKFKDALEVAKAGIDGSSVAVNAAPESVTGGVIDLAMPSEEAEAERLRKLAYISPRGAVLESYLVLESAVLEAAEREGYDRKRSGPGARVALRALKDLPLDLKAAIDRLITLRNQATHAKEFDLLPDAAIDYAQTVQQIAHSLQFYSPLPADE